MKSLKDIEKITLQDSAECREQLVGKVLADAIYIADEESGEKKISLGITTKNNSFVVIKI